MYKHILAALDSSSRAPHVLLHAAELAARFGAVLHVCRAVQVPVGLPVDAWTLTGDDLTARLLEHAQGDLDARLAALPATLPCKGSRIARYGAPFEVVITAAREVHADLVVVGSHGFGVLDRLLGTTADRVVHRAPCSVLVVRDEAAR
jgi:nucleotide-binding universal stress UspA family protein